MTPINTTDAIDTNANTPAQRTEGNGWPLCEHTHTVPGCVPCAYRAWANGRNSTFTSHGIPYEAFCAGYYIARGRI